MAGAALANLRLGRAHRQKPKRNMHPYFDVWNGDTVTQDNEEVECATDQAACEAAAKALLDLATDIIVGENNWI